MLKISDVEPITALNGLFTDGSVAGGISPTRLVAAFFNAVQTELVNIVETSGMQLDKDDSTQVLKALHKMFLQRSEPFADIKLDGATAISKALANLGLGTAAKLTAASGVQGAAGWMIIPALVGGVEKNIILQWGNYGNDATGDSTVNFPIPFPNAVRQVMVSAAATGTGAYAGYNSPTKTGFKGNLWASVNTRQPGNASFWAIGE